MRRADDTDIRDSYERDGYYFPFRAMSAVDAKGYVTALEAHETARGGPLQSNMRLQVHLLFTWANELVRHPKILDAVENIIGPNFLCWVSNFLRNVCRFRFAGGRHDHRWRQDGYAHAAAGILVRFGWPGRDCMVAWRRGRLIAGTGYLRRPAILPRFANVVRKSVPGPSRRRNMSVLPTDAP